VTGPTRVQLNDIAEAKVRAEEKGGWLRSAGERTDVTAVQAAPRLTPYQAALKDAGLSIDVAKRWRVRSFVPEAQLEEYFAKQREKGQAITSADVDRMGRQWLKEQKRQE
jgi:hypothetical protein